LTEIRGYTLAQFEGFSRAANRALGARLVGDTVSRRAATYERRDFMSYLAKLEAGVDGR
jgi:hypothetical protein